MRWLRVSTLVKPAFLMMRVRVPGGRASGDSTTVLETGSSSGPSSVVPASVSIISKVSATSSA